MYPSKNQILKRKPKIPQEIFDVVLSWKKEFLHDWKNTTDRVKTERLRYLAVAIILINSPHTVNISVEAGDQYNYNHKTKTITLDKRNPSIISTMHEIAHHLEGRSELKATVWSVWLFKTCFPGLYKGLKWQDHLLVKK